MCLSHLKPMVAKQLQASLNQRYPSSACSRSMSNADCLIIQMRMYIWLTECKQSKAQSSKACTVSDKCPKNRKNKMTWQLTSGICIWFICLSLCRLYSFGLWIVCICLLNHQKNAKKTVRLQFPIEDTADDSIPPLTKLHLKTMSAFMLFAGLIGASHQAFRQHLAQYKEDCVNTQITVFSARHLQTK